MNLRLAETHPEDYPTTLGDKRFAELVGERSDGRINVEVFAGAQLGEEASVIEQVQTGAIEMTRVSSSPMSEFTQNMGVFSLPFIFDDSEHMWRFLEGGDGQALLDGLGDSGFKGLTYFDPGARSFYNTGDPVSAVEDLQGLKFRIQQSDISVAFMEALGISPTPMDYGEVYSGLQSGLIDGAENNPPSYFSASHYEVAQNYTLDEHTRVPEVLIMNQAAWDQLDDADKELIQTAATDATPFQRERWNGQVEEDMNALREAGINIVSVDDISLWKDAVEPVIEQFEGDYGAVLDQIRAAS